MNPTSETPASRDLPRQIDAEHRIQFELLSALEAALDGAPANVEPGEILDQYVDYSELHFMSEQLLMRLYAYPEYEGHVRDHAVLIERMNGMRELFAAGDLESLGQVLAEQRRQLGAHVQDRDRSLDRFLDALESGA